MSLSSNWKLKTFTSSVILYFPVVCKPGGIDISELVEKCCNNCHIKFFVCRSCRNQGQTYCSKKCSRVYRDMNHRKSQSKYRTSEKGKKKNKINERRRRKRLRKEKSVADRGTTLDRFGCKISPSCSGSYSDQPDADAVVYRQDFSTQAGKSRTGRCHFCGTVGTIVDKFPRRGYKSCKSNRGRAPDISPSLRKC